MRFFLLLLCISLSLFSCKSSKKAITKTPKKEVITLNTKVENIVNHAKSFEGVKYQFGGTTKQGMDCSGLIYVAYRNENIILPRISRDMAKQGTAIALKDVTKGDLLFFKTNKRHAKINHVGLVTSTKNNSIKFIHATTSKGVISSFLNESYWENAFVKARRIL